MTEIPNPTSECLRESEAAAPHLFEYRASSRLFGKCFYLSIFLGAEKRGAHRLVADGERRSFLSLAIDILGFVWLLGLASVFFIGLAVVIAYLVKSGLGIDLFDGHFWLHDLFYS